jgi:hypothetical protein
LVRRAFGFEGFQGVDAGARDFLLGDLQQAQQASDRVGDALLGLDFRDDPIAERGHAHDRLVGLHLDDFLIGSDRVTHRDAEADDGGLGDGLAELGHEDGDGGHLGKS